MQVEADARAEERLLTRRFHEEGAAAFPDWKQRCDDLMKMGADAQIAKLLVDTPGGVKIAAALAEDPAALERIANIQSPTRARRRARQVRRDHRGRTAGSW